MRTRQASPDLERVVRAAAVGGSLRGATFLRVGDPIPGYLDVEADTDTLARLGVREVPLALPDWEARVARVAAAPAEALVAQARDRWAGDPAQARRTAPRSRWRCARPSTSTTPPAGR